MREAAPDKQTILTGKRLAVLVSVLLLAVLAGLRAWSDIFTIAWQDPEQSQVLLALPACIALLCMRRGSLAQAVASTSLLGLIATLIGAGLSWYGYLHATQSLWHFGALLMLVGAAWSVLGDQVVLKALPALIALLAMVPVPNLLRQDIALPLQQLTATGAEFVLVAFGLNVERAGMTLFYQGKPIAIEEACNGMRMVFALALVCYAFVMSLKLNTFSRLLLIGFSPLLAVLCNIIRVVPTVVIYGTVGDSAGDVFHDMSGWAMIVVAALMLLGLIRLLAWAEVPIYADQVQRPVRTPFTPIAAPHWAKQMFAPVGVVLVLSVALSYSLSVPGPDDAKAYHQHIQTIAQSTSNKITGLTAEPIELPEGSLKMLRANTARAIQYTDQASGASGQFLLIQSKDARDLSGHYPPRCYPNVYGYIERQRIPKQWQALGTTLHGFEYTFAQTDQPNAPRWVVMHFFALPNGTTTGSLPQMREAAADYLRRHEGAAQVQMLFSEALTSPQQREQLFIQTLEAHRALILTILGKPEPANVQVANG